MESDLILEIDNVGPISHAKIDIGKINVVGGINSSGKSTASKFLYCFLKSNSQSGSDIVLNNGLRLLRTLSERLRRRYFHIMEEEDQERLKRISFFSRRSFLYNREILVEDFLDISEDFISIYNKYFEDINVDTRSSYIQEDIDELKEYVQNILDKEDFIYTSSIYGLLDMEFNIQGPSNFGNIVRLYSSSLGFKDEFNFKEYLPLHNNVYPIENIFYLDSFSIFDREVNGLFNSEHVPSLLNNINQYYRIKPGMSEKREDIFKKVQEDINELIGGTIENINPRENVYRSNEGDESLMKNTASGIKQIGVVQKLLNLRKLVPGSYLIIDEPEVSLHPEWQVKFAGVLLLLVKDLDVSLYINTHSPLFIEAIKTFADKYDLLEDTNFYLTKEDSPNKFFFEKLIPDELYQIYEELGQPYDYLDDIQISNMFKDRIKETISNHKG